MAILSKAVILLGGPSKGTRMRPLSLDIPKPLFPLAGRSIIWHSIQALSKIEGLREVILIGFYEDNVFAPFVKEASRDFPNLSIRYFREHMALGTAGGLYHFRDLILKGNPQQIFVLNADIASTFPLKQLQDFHNTHRGVGSILALSVEKELAKKFGCIIHDPTTNQAIHYVEKPENFISSTINGGIYLFDKSIFGEIKVAMDLKLRQEEEGFKSGRLSKEGELRLEQDVITILCEDRKLWVYKSSDPWIQIKSAASAIPANTLLLNSYKTTNPSLLRNRSPTVALSVGVIGPTVDSDETLPTHPTKAPSSILTAEIIEPCFIDPTAQIHPTAKIGPNVSIGPNVVIEFGVRVRDSIILEGSILGENSVVLWSVICEGCVLGAWSRVEGEANGGVEGDKIGILAKDVTVLKEVNIRCCIVLPSKVLSKNAKNKVLL